MTNEKLSPLKAWEEVKKYFPFKVNELEYLNADIIEAALKRNVELEKENETLKSIKFIVADDMPAEEKLNKINELKFLCQDIPPMKIEPLYDEKTLKKLKALEIIKEKEVNVFIFLHSGDLETYNDMVEDNRKLTQEEFDLLREVLL